MGACPPTLLASEVTCLVPGSSINDDLLAEVQELPGCFASGRDLEELRDGIVEAITLYLGGEPPSGPRKASATALVDEMRVLVTS